MSGLGDGIDNSTRIGSGLGYPDRRKDRGDDGAPLESVHAVLLPAISADLDGADELMPGNCHPSSFLKLTGPGLFALLAVVLQKAVRLWIPVVEEPKARRLNLTPVILG